MSEHVGAGRFERTGARRRPGGVRLGVSDDHEGLVAAHAMEQPAE